jgi:hypothetical protein
MAVKNLSDDYNIVEEEIECEKYEEFNLESKIIYSNNDKVVTVKLTSREIISICNKWEYNRDIKEERVTQIYDDYVLNIKNNYMPVWMFQIIFDSKTKKYSLLDGQHRKEALKRYLTKYDIDFKDDKEFLCIVYIIYDCEYENRKLTIDLFNKINDSSPFKMEDKIDIFTTEIIDSFLEDKILSNGIRKPVVYKDKKEAQIAHSPYMNKNELKKILSINIEKLKTMPIDLIIGNFKIMNCIISLKNDEEMWGGKKTPEDEKKESKAKQLNFYLNLKSSKWPIERIMKYIDRPNDIDGL